MQRIIEESSNSDEKNSGTQQSQIANDVRLFETYQKLVESLAEREKLTIQLEEEKSQHAMNLVLLSNVIQEMERYKKLNAELIISKQILFNELEKFKREQPTTTSTSSESPSPPQMRM